jgi:hypothetical protein
MRLLDSIADLFRLSWHLARACSMSREALELENEKVRPQIAELKAEGARADPQTRRDSSGRIVSDAGDVRDALLCG